MPKIPGLNKFNGQIAILKREAQTMRETLNKLQDIHERKLIKNKAYRIGKAARQFETQLRQLNNLVETIEQLRPATAKWDIKFGELVIMESED